MEALPCCNSFAWFDHLITFLEKKKSVSPTLSFTLLGDIFSLRGLTNVGNNVKLTAVRKYMENKRDNLRLHYYNIL